MLTEKQINEIREELDNCKKPLFFFHDDPDGLCSFLLLYRYKMEGKGVIVKSVPKLDEKFIRKVDEYDPDKIFILDLAMVDQDFIDTVKRPVVWIDHHEPLERHNVKIFNPRIAKKSDNTPVTHTCYQVAKQDMWIAMCGCIGDWYIPPFLNGFKKEYPKLIEIDTDDPGEILFNTKLGMLVRIISFVLKGKTSDVLKCIKIFTRIESPYEILNQETSKGRFIFKRYEKINANYEELLNKAIKNVSKDKLLVFSYEENKMSFTGDLSNELLHRFPDKLIIIAREKEDEMRMSLRSKHKQLPPVLNKALEGVEGYGGGHEYACGACVKKKDFKKFTDALSKEF
jgi:single-stranded DNA-specific DHH superfamily exonuclease